MMIHKYPKQKLHKKHNRFGGGDKLFTGLYKQNKGNITRQELISLLSNQDVNTV